MFMRSVFDVPEHLLRRLSLSLAVFAVFRSTFVVFLSRFDCRLSAGERYLKDAFRLSFSDFRRLSSSFADFRRLLGI